MGNSAGTSSGSIASAGERTEVGTPRPERAARDTASRKQTSTHERRTTNARAGAPTGGQSSYTSHTCEALNERFAARPFQGATPESARFLFIGLDANFAAEIAKNPIYGRLLEYLDNGVAFWRAHKEHHPFLLNNYSGGGWRYHRAFKNIGFRPEHAADVSFVELLHVPTVGKSDLKRSDLDLAHLQRISEAIDRGSARYVFISFGVARLMRLFPMFDWLPKEPNDGQPLKEWAKRGRATVYWHYHFSAAAPAKAAQLAAIGGRIEPRGSATP
jgi:hypothetical protein